MKVYISGKIGEEVLSDATREKFAKAEKMLRSKGYDVFNPTTSGFGARAEALAKANDTDFYREILVLDLGAMKYCDAIYLLPDYINSPGADVELSFAKAIGLNILYANLTEAKWALAECFLKRVENGYTDNIDMTRPWNEALADYYEKYLDKFWLPL